MRAGHFFANGLCGKLNVFFAEETGHFEQIRFAQGDGGLAMRTGYFLAEIAFVKPDMHRIALFSRL